MLWPCRRQRMSSTLQAWGGNWCGIRFLLVDCVWWIKGTCCTAHSEGIELPNCVLCTFHRVRDRIGGTVIVSSTVNVSLSLGQPSRDLKSVTVDVFDVCDSRDYRSATACGLLVLRNRFHLTNSPLNEALKCSSRNGKVDPWFLWKWMVGFRLLELPKLLVKVDSWIRQ